MTNGKPDITIYTDGACDPNPGPGGWGAIICAAGSEVKLSGHERDTTNNRMEMTAAIKALKSLEKPSKVTLYTDSEYLKNGITKWLPNWIARNWKTSTRRPVKNQDLWKKLISAEKRHEVTWSWLRGHAGNRMNNRVDRLARSAIRRR